MREKPLIFRETFSKKSIKCLLSSLRISAKRSAEKYNLSSRAILVELGRRRTVGGQEDMIEDLALDMAREQGTI